MLKSATSQLFSLTGPIGSSSTSSSSISQSEGTFLTSVHVHSLDIPNRHQYHHLGWPIFQMTNFPKSMQSVLQSSGRAPGAMGSKFSHIFLREVSLGEKLYFGGKMICCNFFLTNKKLMDRKTKIHKDKHRNNCEICQSQVTWKLEFKCQFPLSCLSIIICTTCDFLFIRYVDLIHYNWPHSGQKSLSLFHPVMEILGPLIDISGLLWFQELLSLE